MSASSAHRCGSLLLPFLQRSLAQTPKPCTALPTAALRLMSTAADPLEALPLPKAADTGLRETTINPFMSRAHPGIMAAGTALGVALTGAGAYAIYTASLLDSHSASSAAGPISSSSSSSSSSSGSSENRATTEAAARPGIAAVLAAAPVTFWTSPRVQGVLVALGGVFGAIGVAGGAFGFHGLKRILAGRVAEPERLVRFWEIAVAYELWHSCALMATAALPPTAAVPAGLCFASGVVLFSWSIMGYALTGRQALQYMTPFGGLAFMAGWGVIAVYSATRALAADKVALE